MPRRPRRRRDRRAAPAADPQRLRERRDAARAARRCARPTCCQTYLEGAGLDVERFEPTPGRRSVVARIEGTDPDRPDAVPHGPHRRRARSRPPAGSRDPFGGELVDGEVWGRGAIDMLNLTASMAVATKHLARAGWRPRGTLIYLGVADEEAGGAHGAEWLVDHEWDAVGVRLRGHRERRLEHATGPTGQQVVLTVGEKGVAWRRLRVPGHAGPRLDALRRRQRAGQGGRGGAPAGRLPAGGRDRRHLAGLRRASLDLPDDLRARSARPGHGSMRRVELDVPDRRAAKFAHACTHTTFSPERRPRRREDQRDPRRGRDRGRHPHAARPDRRGRRPACWPRRSGRPGRAGRRSSTLHERPQHPEPAGHAAVRRARRGSPRKVYPEATLLPRLTAGGTDATFFRGRGHGRLRLRAAVAAASRSQDFASRFHGHDERIDVESLRPHDRSAGSTSAVTSWVERRARALAGRTVVVTRAAEQAGELSDRLRAAGADGGRGADDRDRRSGRRRRRPRRRGRSASTATTGWCVTSTERAEPRSPTPSPATGADLARRRSGLAVVGPGHGRRGCAPRPAPSPSCPSASSPRACVEVFPPGPARVLLAQAEAARPVLADGPAGQGLGRRRGRRLPHACRPPIAPELVERAGAGRRHHLHLGLDGAELPRRRRVGGSVPPVVVCIGPVTADAAAPARARRHRGGRPSTTLAGLVEATVVTAMRSRCRHSAAGRTTSGSIAPDPAEGTVRSGGRTRAGSGRGGDVDE